jgi:hypothetical protein
VLLDLVARIILCEEVPADSRLNKHKVFKENSLSFCWLTAYCSHVLLISAFLFSHPLFEQYNVSISSLCNTLKSRNLLFLFGSFFSSEYVFLKVVIVQSTDHDAGESAGGMARQPVRQPPTIPLAIHLDSVSSFNRNSSIYLSVFI